MPKRPYINATKKSKPLFTQQQVISVQDIHFYYSTHTHGSYILSTHRFQSRKIGFLVPLLGATRADFFLLLLSFSCEKSLHFQCHIKSLSSASKAAAISSASELLPPSSSLESFEDSSADSSATSFFSSSSSSSSSSLASSCLRLCPLQR